MRKIDNKAITDLVRFPVKHKKYIHKRKKKRRDPKVL
jgi:hypothetical protein